VDTEETRLGQADNIRDKMLQANLAHKMATDVDCGEECNASETSTRW